MARTHPPSAVTSGGALGALLRNHPQRAFTAIVGALCAMLVLVGNWTEPTALVLELGLCAAAASSGWRLVGGGIATGLLLAAVALTTAQGSRFSILSVTLVLIVASAQGRWSLVALFAAWYVPLLAFIEATGFANPTAYLAAAGAWTLFLALGVLVGAVVHRQIHTRERLALANQEAMQGQRRSIARDLHDTVAHATTAIVMRAETAKLHADPALVADLDYIATVGRNSLRDLRGMLAAMRSDDGEPAGYGSLSTESFEDLLERRVADLTKAGYQVRVLAQADTTALPESIRGTLNHVVSEAAANIERHARPGSDCALMIDVSDAAVDFVASNATGGRSAVPSNHFGLIGLEERVGALGGTVQVVSREPQWVLRVQLPLIGGAEQVHVVGEPA